MGNQLKKVYHIMEIGSEKYSFKAGDVYSSFGSTFGVTKAPENDNTVYKGRITSDDFIAGKVIKIKCRGTSGSGTNTKYRDFSFECPFEKARSALAAISGKTVSVGTDTYTLGDARIPQRRRFS